MTPFSVRLGIPGFGLGINLPYDEVRISLPAIDVNGSEFVESEPVC